jgi:hypothetical protein
MKTITIKLQSELDALDIEVSAVIEIEGGDYYNPIILSKHYKNAEVILVKTAVVEMRGSSRVNEMRESSRVNEMRESSRVNVMRESSRVNVMRGSSRVNVMWGSSRVNEMRESSRVNEMWESSQVNEMRESSRVNEMRESSQVNEMRESSQVNEMRESSRVNEMRESSRVNVMRGQSLVANALGSNKIKTLGYNIIKTTKSNRKNLVLELSDDSYVFEIPEIDITQLSEFEKFYSITRKDKTTLTCYKAVRKLENGDLHSNHDKNFAYEIGKAHTEDLDPQQNESCSKGLHVSGLSWAVNFGRDWPNVAIIQVDVPIKSILISKDTDGKFRTGKLKVIREVPKSEWI